MMGSDFKFWEEKSTIHLHSHGDKGGFEVKRHADDQVGASSPRLWTRAPVDFSQTQNRVKQLGLTFGPHFRQETAALLPQKHHYSFPSPRSRLRAIMDGRREMMEMIKNAPESSYELSLKDIVDDQQNTNEAQEKEVQFEEKKSKNKREDRILHRTKNTKQIRRSESMESEVFLLKMFLPASLSSKKKASARKCEKTCLRQSSAEKQAKKDWWKMIFLAVNNTSERKCKSKAQRGCLF